MLLLNAALFPQFVQSGIHHFFPHLTLALFGGAFLLMSLRDLSVPELLAGCLSTDGEREVHWREFQRRYDDLISILLTREYRRRFGSVDSQEARAAVQDLKQEIYMRLIRDDGSTLRKFRGTTDKSMRAFLCVVSRRFLSNYARSQRNREQRYEAATPSDDGFGYERTDPEPISREMTDRIDERDLIDHMDRTLRGVYNSRNMDRDIAIFILYYVVGCSSQELATEYDFGISASAIETLVHRMKMAIKDKIS